MTCKEAEKKIPQLLEDRLEPAELEGVLKHVERCPSCKEELTIQFLVTTGMQRLEEGSTFHLGRELSGLLQERHGKLNRLKRLRIAAYSLEAVAVAVSAATVILAVLTLR